MEELETGEDFCAENFVIFVLATCRILLLVDPLFEPNMSHALEGCRSLTWVQIEHLSE